MARVEIANLKGPQGETGPQGLPGAEGVPTDAAVAQLVQIPSGTKTALDGSYVRQGTLALNVKDVGAVGDGVTDDTVAIQSAFDTGDLVYFPAGTYLVSDELKVPSRTQITGAGMDVAVVRMAAGTDRALNVITNESNNRTARFVYDEKIRIADITVDGNYAARVTTSVPWEGNGCGIMLSAVRDSVVERVKVIDAPLHCFAVDASWLPTEATGGPDFYAESPSYNVTIRDCIGINPGVDDCFTTHYSHDILIENCHAEFSTINPSSGGVQNGFEVDDGSWRVTVRDCYAKGAQNAVQVKGHTYAPPAYDITIDNVTADGCACGFAAVSGGSLVANSVRFLNCTVESPDMNVGTESNRGSSMKIYGYQGVTVRDLVVRNAVFGGIILWTAGAVIIDGVRGENAYTASPLGAEDGFIRITGETDPAASVTVRNVIMKGLISVGSVVRNNETEGAFSLRVDNVRATGSPGAAAISDTFYSDARRYTRIEVTGFSQPIMIRAGSGNVTGAFTTANPILTGLVNPSGVVAAAPGTLYLRSGGGAGATLYVKESGTGTSGWAAK